LCCVFVLFFFVLCTICCQFLWIVHFFITPSVFSNVYLQDKKDFCNSMGNTKEWIRRTERNWSRPKHTSVTSLNLQLGHSWCVWSVVICVWINFQQCSSLFWRREAIGYFTSETLSIPHPYD
jgi:hypothetical protein